MIHCLLHIILLRDNWEKASDVLADMTILLAYIIDISNIAIRVCEIKISGVFYGHDVKEWAILMPNRMNLEINLNVVLWMIILFSLPCIDAN